MLSKCFVLLLLLAVFNFLTLLSCYYSDCNHFMLDKRETYFQICMSAPMEEEVTIKTTLTLVHVKNVKRLDFKGSEWWSKPVTTVSYLPLTPYTNTNCFLINLHTTYLQPLASKLRQLQLPEMYFFVDIKELI